jgi:hypothetical protein
LRGASRLLVRPREREDAGRICGDDQPVRLDENNVGLDEGLFGGIERIGGHAIAVFVEMKKQIADGRPNFLRGGIDAATLPIVLPRTQEKVPKFRSVPA